LADSTSPYLLQHSQNPVDWHPWGQEAFTRAKSEDKPIFLSIGYAACHWCHVMAHESFEDPDLAAFMNEHFINIKVDREERPDIDGIYMQAVVAMTGSGGWPMSVFLSPDLKPFYAGTYFPPVRRYNMPAFREILTSLVSAWMEERGKIEIVGNRVLIQLQAQAKGQEGSHLRREQLNAAVKSLCDSYDWGYGGWGEAPKFPQAMALDFLLQHGMQNQEYKDQSIKLVKHCLKTMSRGGMYDVVGGGFSRYSTDNFWRVPHFEKMLYDNALLARTYLHAWQVTGEPDFRRIAEETLDFVSRELSHPEGGFYSSLDADSEGEEGRFYVWTQEQIRTILQEDTELFEAAYGITARGNWDGKNVLQRALDDATLAARFRLDPKNVPDKMASAHARLLTARASRVRPATDDKILTAWNALMLAAFAEAARVLSPLENSTGLGSDHNQAASGLRKYYYITATRNAEFLLSALRPTGRLQRAWRAGRTTSEVFLEDYAALILALLELYQTDFEVKWFRYAVELADEMIGRFADPAGGFFDTPEDGETLLIRPKDLQDNAIPSGNALACEALLRLAAFTDNGKYRDLAEGALPLSGGYALRYPLGFARWLSTAGFARGTVKQVALLGDPHDKLLAQMLNAVRTGYRPNAVVAVSEYPVKENAPALLKDRAMLNGNPTAYVCEGFLCKQPATDLETFLDQLVT
jgi:uncharacterized protein YyaL (SSP411 family)